MFTPHRFTTLALLAALTLLTGPTTAQVVDIPDPNLERVIRETLDIPRNAPLLKADMLRLTHLSCSDENIVDLTGLEHAINIVRAHVGRNPIVEISPLGSLPKLDALHIAGTHTRDLAWLANTKTLKSLFAIHCEIEDISGLADLTNLMFLDLAANRITDISPLANLTKLEKLHIERNQIVDASPLAGLTNLKELHIFHNLITDFDPFLGLAITDIWRDEECAMPRLPIRDRIENRNLPSAFLPWDSSIRNTSGDWWDLSIPYLERATTYDLWWHGPGHSFGLRLNLTPQGYTMVGNLRGGLAERETMLSLNPNMLILADHRQKYAGISRFGEDWFGWQRDAAGNILPVDANDPRTQFLIDFKRPEVQDAIVQRAAATVKCGWYDGIMFDSWGVDRSAPKEEWYSLLGRIRAAVPDDFLILFNTNEWYSPELAPYINGAFMETFPHVREDGYTRDRITEIETNLIKYEATVREPKINCLRGFGVGAEAPDSPNNRRWMRLFTTMSLTCSDGYVIYTLGDFGGVRQFQEHIWHAFWDADLGQPVSSTAQLYQETEGLYIREFTNGWAVYNRSGAPRAIELPEEARGVASNWSATTHALPDMDGEIYLRVKPVNPADVNGDGVVNIFDLTIVAQAISGTDSRGDVNGDGVVNVFDLVIIAKAIE